MPRNGQRTLIIRRFEGFRIRFGAMRCSEQANRVGVAAQIREVKLRRDVEFIFRKNVVQIELMTDGQLQRRRAI